MKSGWKTCLRTEANFQWPSVQGGPFISPIPVLGVLLTADTFHQNDTGLLIPGNYLQFMSFPLGPCTESISQLLRCLCYLQIDNFYSVLVKILNFNSQQHYSFFFFYSRIYSYSFWCERYTSMLGIVVPMDTDVCTIVAEWVEWDLRLFLVIFIIRWWTHCRIVSSF